MGSKENERRESDHSRGEKLEKMSICNPFQEFFFSTDGQRNGVVAREECGVERVFSSLGEIMT